VLARLRRFDSPFYDFRFALDFDEQKRSGFRYQYSNYQIEYSRYLVFEVGGQMDQVFQALIGSLAEILVRPKNASAAQGNSCGEVSQRSPGIA
jgi:hypothetical protein